MKIEVNKVVSLGYELHSSTGQGEKKFVEKTSSEKPFVFLFGNGGLIQQFEANLEGKTKGDSFEFEISSENAYGNFDLDSIVEIPMEAFEGADKGMLVPGKVIPMMDNQGHHLQGKVKEVKDKSVVMDFNHPLAGQNLHFKGEIYSVRDASADELAHGHVHGEGGHHH